ncbi:hypothetical protein DL98DRAFT_573200 [Cadophora sp. DSE1049]|nr:hypothetical protein DL98DRAFT_573200 [Cadophora sp. DSE1049]
MARIRSSSRAPAVRKEMARLSGKTEWLEDRWWREFLSERRQFLSQRVIPAKPSVAEKLDLETRLKEWVNNSREWWGGADGWAEDGTLVEWHLSQYLRARRDETLDAQPEEIAQPLAGSQGDKDSAPFDPVRNV